MDLHIVNEAMRREMRYWADRIVAQHEDKLSLSCAIFSMRKMITHVAAARRSGAPQMDQSYLSHVLSGYIGDSFSMQPIDMTYPADVGRISEISSRDAIQRVSVIAKAGKKRETKRTRKERMGWGGKRRKAPEAPRGRGGAMAAMEKRTVSTTMRR